MKGKQQHEHRICAAAYFRSDLGGKGGPRTQLDLLDPLQGRMSIETSICVICDFKTSKQVSR